MLDSEKSFEEGAQPSKEEQPEDDGSPTEKRGSVWDSDAAPVVDERGSVWDSADPTSDALDGSAGEKSSRNRFL